MGTLDEIKGRVAQAIVEQLFTDLGYTVFHSGVESSFPGFSKRERRGYASNTAKALRALPDFICLKKNEEEEPLFIEVKFNGENHFDFVKKYGDTYPYPEVFFILVSPWSITVQKASELAKGTRGTGWKLLPDFKELGISEEIAKRYVRYCKYLLGGVRKPLSTNPTPLSEDVASKE